MDYGALPPEVNSGRMYAGPGSGSMLAAAAGWAGLAADLRSGATGYGTLVSELTSGPWMGPSSTAMTAAAAPTSIDSGPGPAYIRAELNSGGKAP